MKLKPFCFGGLFFTINITVVSLQIMLTLHSLPLLKRFRETRDCTKLSMSDWKETQRSASWNRSFGNSIRNHYPGICAGLHDHTTYSSAHVHIKSVLNRIFWSDLNDQGWSSHFFHPIFPISMKRNLSPFASTVTQVSNGRTNCGMEANFE